MQRTFFISVLAVALACCAKEPVAELNMADEPAFQAMPPGAIIRIIRTACYGSCPIYSITVF